MRLIDADSVLSDIEDLKKSPWYREGELLGAYHAVYLARKEAVQIVAAGIKGEPTVGGWVSVKERLPEDEDECIVGMEGKWIGIGWYHGSNEKWVVDGESYVNGYVTHWMAIPDLPEEGA